MTTTANRSLPAFILPAVILAFFSCSQPSARKPALSPAKLYGRWETVYFRVDMETYRGSDSSKTIEVNESDWEAAMNMRPIRNYFWRDSTYNVLHYNLKDSVVLNVTGKWRVEGDSLYMKDVKPREGPEYAYSVKVSGDIAELNGIEDSDGDGTRDDRYYSTWRKYKRPQQ